MTSYFSSSLACPHMELRHIRGNTYIIPGSPTTLVYINGSNAWVVDPGLEDSRGLALCNLLKSKGLALKGVILTHSHADHIGALSSIRAFSYAPEVEACLIKSRILRHLITYGYYQPKSHHIGLFDAPDIKVDKAFKPGERIGPFKTFPLIGHSVNQCGVETPDRVAYVADALFGDQLIEKVGIPFYLDYSKAIESIEFIEQNLIEDIVIVSHGPILWDKQRIHKIVELNLSRLSMLKDLVYKSLSEKPLSVEELTIKLLKLLHVDPTPSNVVLSSQTVKSIIIELADQEYLKPEVIEEKIAWHSKITKSL